MAKQPTNQQRKQWEKIRELGCIVELENEYRRCESMAEIHHAKTGGGGRKNHSLIFPLCPLHHRGALGIHHMGRRKWQEIYGTEQELLDKVLVMLEN